MSSFLRKPIVGTLSALFLLALMAAPAFAQFDEEYDPGTPAFQRTWDRTDKPVADGAVERSWLWGPGRTEVMNEPYADSPGGERQVQYFDKSRMEINDPNAVDDGVWFVTNGLLVVELIEGRMQVGDDDFEDGAPANIQIAGDPGNEFAPTYADINDLGLRSLPADNVGDVITRTLTGDNEVGDEPSYADYDVTGAYRVQVPTIDQTIASPFWEFMNSSGPVWEDGEIVDDLLFVNPFYATGYPITPAFWSVVPVAGEDQDVLWQCFERRCLTYTPSNNEGFQVEAGNVGQHYWTWRYGDGTPPPDDFDGAYFAELGPLNESGVEGLATLTLDGDQLTVEIEASGLTPDQEHMQHIHGFSDDAEEMGLHGVTLATCPTPELDENDDGIVDIGEGGAAYGPVVYPLEPYPTANGEGNITYSQTLTVDPAVLGDPTQRVIVLHGLMIEPADIEEYDGTVPVACGPIEEGDAPPPGEFDGNYFSNLAALNESGVSGTASLTLEGDQLTVNVEASGLTPDQEHMQHIHGFSDDAEPAGLQGITLATCPTPELDENDDGIVDIGEGGAAYGPVVYPLEPYPTADAEGNVSYSQTLTVDPAVLGDPTQRVIVLHGLTLDEEYDGTVPVACGPIEEGDAPPPPEEQIFSLQFGELNNSGVSASGSASLDGDQLTVQINASGLEADQVHAQHVHGQEEGWAFCPGPDYDGDDDNTTVEVAEGVPAYGAVLHNLYLDVEAEEFPSADAEGNLTFEQTYTVDPEVIGDLGDRVVVLHGMTVGDEYDAGQPVACALIVPDGLQAFSASELSGANERPDPVESDGSGAAWFWYDETGEELYYMLSAWGLSDMTAAHIHQGGAEDSGGVVVGLFTPETETGFGAFGIVSSGRITADDLVNDLEGMTVADLVALFGDAETESGAYVNVHTVTHSAGEIRDQVDEALTM